MVVSHPLSPVQPRRFLLANSEFPLDFEAVRPRRHGYAGSDGHRTNQQLLRRAYRTVSKMELTEVTVILQCGIAGYWKCGKRLTRNEQIWLGRPISTAKHKAIRMKAQGKNPWTNLDRLRDKGDS